MRVGAHVSSSGRIGQSLQRAQQIGAECAQLFVGAPQRWFGASYTEPDISEFRQHMTDLGIGPNVVHALYLVNLATPDEALRTRSIHALVNQMHWCDQLGVMGLVVHVGSRKKEIAHQEALDLVARALEEILARSERVRFLIENTAGMGTSIGSDFADIGYLIDRLGRDSRLGVCLDTAHTFEAGYDIRSREGVESVFDAFDQAVGLERLAAIHANDSKTAFGSRVDRHENIGLGHIGEEAFSHFLAHPAVQDVPLYLEVPGLAGKGPDRENIDVLRRLAGVPPLPPMESPGVDEADAVEAP